MTEKAKLRSRLMTLPSELRDELGEVVMQKGMRATSRRDKINELFNQYHIDFRSVGTGTNRHIIRYDGYVIKIALDKEGIADNRQEWVMSEQLAPHVAQAYEISKGGHLLVAEYAPAFSSFSEMLLRRDSITAILADWCKRFLIGDVGIIDKNYANWGINSAGRPVCIDYAYVFPVSMDLFRCTCGNKNMVMDNTFSEYRCPNCQTRYADSSLRSTITQQERLRLFETIEGVHMDSAETTIEVEVDNSNEYLNNPDMPDPYKCSSYVIDELIRRRGFNNII